MVFVKSKLIQTKPNVTVLSIAVYWPNPAHWQLSMPNSSVKSSRYYWLSAGLRQKPDNLDLDIDNLDMVLIRFSKNSLRYDLKQSQMYVESNCLFLIIYSPSQKAACIVSCLERFTWKVITPHLSGTVFLINDCDTNSDKSISCATGRHDSTGYSSNWQCSSFTRFNGDVTRS